MKVQELVGSKVWVKERGLAERVGHISSVLKPVDLEEIESSVTASTFRIEMASGGVVETTGVNISKIEHAGYVQESAKSHKWF